MASCSRHVVVLSINIASPDSHWLLLRIVSLWNLGMEFLIWLLLKPSPGTMLNNQLVVTQILTDHYTILSLHDFPSDGVLLIILWLERRTCCGLEMSLLLHEFFLFSLFRKLFKNGLANLYLKE